MHGLINRSIQGFLVTTYGEDVWQDIACVARVPDGCFESMLCYPDALTSAVISAACDQIECTPESLLEDIGIYLVTDPDLEAVRRLMRFGGPTFEDFILSLDELHDRARMAVPELTLPHISLTDVGGGHYEITTRWPLEGAVSFVSGLVRAMADDYGALAVLDIGPRRWLESHVLETLRVFVAEPQFSEGRSFLLGESVA